jgi:hypothetical protein
MADEQQQQFEAMLIAFTEMDNVVRKQAEEAYNQALSDPIWVIQALVQVGCHSANTAAANVAFVMLRKLLMRKSDAFDQCPPDVQAHVKQSLVQFFGTTEDKLIRRACASCISNLAVKLSSDGNNAWPELWELLMNALQDESMSPELRAACCLIFSQTASFLLTNYLRGHLMAIIGALEGCLMSGHSGLAQEAAEAVVEVARSCDPADIQAVARSTLIPTLVEATGQYTLTNDSDTAEALAGAIAAIADTRPDIITPHLSNVLNAMMTIARNPQLDKDLRHTAIDTILTYAEKDGKTFRKNRTFSTEFFELMVQYTSRPEMEDDWATTYDASDEADGSDFEAGASAMDRICVVLRGKQVQDMATEHIMANIDSNAWEMRSAALTILTYVAEGCKKQFIKFLDMIVDRLIMPKVNDPHPMVRFCAMQCIAQMATDFSPRFQESYAHKVLPALCGLLSDDVPRLRAMAAATIDQFFEQLEEDEDEEDLDEEELAARVTEYKKMTPYMAHVIQALVPALQNAQYNFQRLHVLTAMATCIQVAGKLYTPFVNILVPVFQSVLAMPEEAPNNDILQQIRKMKCIAIECTTLLASNVGAQEFAAYAHDVCNYLLSIIHDGLDNDDIRLRYVLRGWTCMVECLKSEVLPYLDNVMPQLLQVANIECDAEVVEADAGDIEEQKNSKVQIVRIQDPKEGTKTVRLNTSLIDDKDLAITIIMCIVKELKGHMLPYLQPIMDTAMKLLGFNANPDIRETAAVTLGALASVLEQADAARSGEYVAHILPTLLEALENEPELDVCQQMIETLGIVVTKAPHGALNDYETLQKTATILHEIFEESLERLEQFLKKHVEEARNAGDSEEEETKDALNELASDEDFLLTEVAETVGKLVKTTPLFIESFNAKFLPMVSRLLDNRMPGTYHRLGLCLLCDLVEHAPQEAVPHLANIAQAMLTFSASGESEVVQSAMYGGGITCELIAQVVPQPNEDSQAFAREMCQAAVRFLLTPDSTTEEGFSVSANAVSAILRIIEAFPEAVDVMASMRAVASHLPVKDDKDEEIRICDRLVRWASDPSNPVMSDTALRQQIIYNLKRGKYMSPEAREALSHM